MLLIGDNREYCTALVVPDMELIRPLLSTPDSQGLDTSSLNQPAAISTIMSDINKLQRDLAKYERVRRIYLVTEPFTVENGMMTPTLKIKRNVVELRFANEIAAMYESQAKEGF